MKNTHVNLTTLSSFFFTLPPSLPATALLPRSPSPKPTLISILRYPTLSYPYPLSLSYPHQYHILRYPTLFYTYPYPTLAYAILRYLRYTILHAISAPPKAWPSPP
eukprot:1241966-Amorphochlora_amoeboformis.AAC.1